MERRDYMLEEDYNNHILHKQRYYGIKMKTPEII